MEIQAFTSVRTCNENVKYVRITLNGPNNNNKSHYNGRSGNWDIRKTDKDV